MGWFSKECVCKKDLADLIARVTNLELNLERSNSHLISLRGLVNKKLSGDKILEDQNKEQSEDIKTMRYY